MFLNRKESENEDEQKQVQVQVQVEEKMEVFDKTDFDLLKEMEKYVQDLQQQHAPLAKKLRTIIYNIRNTGCDVERKSLLKQLKDYKCSLPKNFKENNDGHSSEFEMKYDDSIRYAY